MARRNLKVVQVGGGARQTIMHRGHETAKAVKLNGFWQPTIYLREEHRPLFI
jgi:hypothetical protein